MNINTTYSTGYHIAILDEPAPFIIAEDPYGLDWYSDIDSWCTETFGVTDIWGDNPVTGWKRLRDKFFFTDEAKLNMFVLRWT